MVNVILDAALTYRAKWNSLGIIKVLVVETQGVRDQTMRKPEGGRGEHVRHLGTGAGVVR